MSESPKPKRAIIYARLSKDEKHSVSILSQIQQCREWCGKNGVAVDQEFIDNGVSGSICPAERSECSKAIAKAKQIAAEDGCAAFVTSKIDRLGREVEGMYAAIRIMGDKVSFISCTEAADLSTTGGKTTFGIMSVMASAYRDFVVERTRDTMRTRKSVDMRVSRHAPYGKRFVAVSIDGQPAFSKLKNLAMRLEDCPEEIENMSIIARLKLAGWKAGKIVENLNQAGRFRRNGKPWTTPTLCMVIQRNLSDEHYRKELEKLN